MDTSKLRSFAVAARVELKKEVAARLGVVLESGSTYRVEYPETVTALERAIREAGGGGEGRRAITERVAYLWFNRIVALRFMDVNGYTGVGVVSPQQRRTKGQPEILADAKRGHIDSSVVDSRTVRQVTGLLNGSRRSNDPQGEAYILLLSAYCRFWNRVMPFMFEEAGDYTELLIPADLLAENSFLAKTAETLSAHDCSDVEVIGWLYQFYIAERKAEIFADFNRNVRAGASEIPAATQLFTPHWIVRFLVENTLGRLWILNRPTSTLVSQMQYYMEPFDDDVDFAKVDSPKEIRILDLACGSGHMLTYAFDLLYFIYEEEGYSPSEIPSLILTLNLYGAEIDERAGSLAAFALTMKARSKDPSFFSRSITPNVGVMKPISFTPSELEELLSPIESRLEQETFWNQFEQADLLGSLITPNSTMHPTLQEHVRENIQESIWGTKSKALAVLSQAEYLINTYHVVIANPPYMANANMSPQLCAFGRQNYPNSCADLFAMFIERSLSLTNPAGFVGMVTMQSWMYLDSFATLRETLLTRHPIESLIHLGAGAFSTISGSVVSTAAFILRRCVEAPIVGRYINLENVGGEAGKEAAFLSDLELKDQVGTLVGADEMRVVPGVPIAYDLTERQLFTRSSLGALFESGGRLKTHNNKKYVRYHWELCRKSERWIPFHNGGERASFYGNDE